MDTSTKFFWKLKYHRSFTLFIYDNQSEMYKREELTPDNLYIDGVLINDSIHSSKYYYAVNESGDIIIYNGISGVYGFGDKHLMHLHESGLSWYDVLKVVTL